MLKSGKSGQTVNSDIYCSQIEEVHKKLKDIDPAMINRRQCKTAHLKEDHTEVQRYRI